MPDGSGKVDDAQARADEGGTRGWAWLPRTRNTWLLIWAGFAAAGFAGLGAYEIWGAGGLVTAQTAGYVVAASALLVLPLLLLFLDPVDGLARGPGLGLPTVTILALAALAAAAVLDALVLERSLLEPMANKVAYFCLLGAAFAPRVWNAMNFAHHKEGNRQAAERAARVEAAIDQTANRASEVDVDAKMAEQRDAESLGAVISTILVFGIIVGAYFVGSLDREPELGASLGVGIFATVVGIFAAIVFLDWIAELPFVRAFARALSAGARQGKYVAAFYDSIDRGLVFIGGHTAGADHINWYTRYGVLAGTLVCLCVMGWYLPAPWGLIPTAVGLVVALSLSRLWSWVEEDRSLASITKFNPTAPQKIGFREDFRDETLLGFIFVLLLIPIGMMQTHVSELMGGPLFQNAIAPRQPIEGTNFLTWLGYFGFELAKALPIVDWADIYHLGPGGDSIEPTRPLGMHAVFAARVMVDLILIAALLQAIGIASRNRQQKSLYDAKHIDRLDELIEKAELQKAVDRTVSGEDVDLKPLDLPELVDFRRYDKERLRDLYVTNPDNGALRLFIATIYKQASLTLDPAIDVLKLISSTHRNERDMFKVFEQACRDHAAQRDMMDVEDIQIIFFNLRGHSGLKDLKFSLIRQAHDLMRGSPRIATPERVLDLLTTISAGAKGERDGFVYTHVEAARVITVIAPELSDPQAIIESLTQFEKNGAEAFGASQYRMNEAVGALKARLAQVAPG